MRKFIIRSAFFGFLVLVIFGGWSAALLHLELTSYFREATIPPDVCFAVCSDSQTEVALLPEVWPHFFNFSISAIQLDQYELKILDLLDRNPGRLKALVVDISPRKLLAQDIDTPLIGHRSAGKRFLLHALHPRESRRSMDGMAVLFRDSILAKRSAKAFKAYRKGRPYMSSIGGRGSAGGARTEEEASRNRDRLLKQPAIRGFHDHLEQVLAGIEEHSAELNAWGPVDGTSKTCGCIRDILTLVKSRGVTPILITTPYHPAFLERIPGASLDNFRKTMREISRACGVAWFDYLEMPFPDDQWRDGNHLNRHGAVFLTERVRRDVEAAAAGELHDD